MSDNNLEKLSLGNQCIGPQKDLEQLVKQRTVELQARVNELEKFYNLAVGRELKMVELKKALKVCQLELRSQADLEEFRNRAKICPE